MVGRGRPAELLTIESWYDDATNFLCCGASPRGEVPFAGAGWTCKHATGLRSTLGDPYVRCHSFTGLLRSLRYGSALR